MIVYSPSPTAVVTVRWDTYILSREFTLEPRTQVTLHAGSGTDSPIDLYWSIGSAIRNDGGDTIIVQNNSGTTVLQKNGY